MENVQAVAFGRMGYVRAVFSRRCRGFAAPLDLVRAELRSAGMLSAMRHNEAMYARLAEDFGGYLVTDENPSDMTGVEIAACWPYSPDGGQV